MRIKKLEISGFKSFADRARLQFGEGITGVVGPNGCGKSNIIDALRWVMGEMSAKHLRGKAMQDVIFAGCETRSALGMAEVTLTFDNDGNVPPSYINFSEIAVTRRLYRDGSSEYLINKSPVRLRDITDLFLGTGVGTRAYSIIEQGRISFVVSARPEERRTLIEEVAGITKFKVRKKAAERRMEATEQNLARVCDVVAELERQLVTLRKQAKKAERYRAMRAQLRDIELHRAVLELLRLTVTGGVQARLQRELAARLGDSARSLEAEEAALSARRMGQAEREEALAQMQARSAELDAAVSNLERDLAHWRTQAEAARAAVARAAAEEADAASRLAHSDAELAQLREQADAQADSAAADDEAVGEAEARVQDATDQLEAVDEELQILREDAMARVKGAAHARAEAGHSARQLQETQAQLLEERRGHEEAAVELAAVQARAQSIAERAAAAAAAVTELEQQQRALTESIPALRGAREQAAAKAQGLRDMLGARRSRLESLAQIVRRLEGYSDGVRHLIGQDGERPVPGIGALVAEAIEVAPEHERAIEAVLGERLQYLLVPSTETAAAAIAHLGHVDGGRSGFILEGVQAAGAAAVGVVPEGQGLLGRAQDVVRGRDGHAEMVAYLLGHVMLVDTLAHAHAAAARSCAPWVFVTAAGEVVDAAGTTQGGSERGAGLLATRREIRDLTEAVAALEADHAEANQAHAAAGAAVAEAEAALQAASQALHAQQLEARGLHKDAEACGSDIRRLEALQQALEAADVAAARLEGLLQRLGASLTARAERADALERAVQAAQAQLEAAEAGQDDVSWRLEELQERRAACASQHGEHAAALTALRVRMAAGRERQAAAAAAHARLAASMDEWRARIARAAGARAEGEAQAQALDAQIAAGEQGATDQVAHAQEAREALLEARAGYQADVEALMHEEEALRLRRRDAGGTQERLGTAKLELQRLALERQVLCEQVHERHDVHLEDVVGHYHDRPAPSPEAIGEQEELTRSIKAMGPINLTAIEECAEVEGRYSFLSSQRDDLQEALDALKQAIQRINRTSRERFREAFDAVNEMFQKVYPRLFRGGTARLELLPADDVLDSGVEIVAMPPGKKLQNVGLLSGGEKALTATALVFAIFLIKPSPFCVLDEVDAPLDEANVGRFNEMLREISQVSQFIVITHNKQTMLQMDRLYGITMEQPGMSKVVTVDLQDRQHRAA